MPRVELKRMNGSLYCAPTNTANVAVASHADFAVTAGSIELWFKTGTLQDAAGVYNLFTIRIDNSNYIQFCLRNTVTIGGFYLGAAGVVTLSLTTTGYSFDNGAWQHAVATWGPLGAFVYVNGVQKGTQAGNKTSTFGSNPTLAIANWVTTGNPYIGALAGIRFYNVALTQAQALQRYQGADIQTGLVSDWRCDNMTGITVTDYKSAHNGTISDITKIYWSNNTPVKERRGR